MKVTNSKPQYVLRRHKFYNFLSKAFVKPFFFLVFSYQMRNKVKFKRNESLVVLSNHQTDLDAVLIEFSLNKHLYPVGTDTIFQGLGGKVLQHCFGIIPKRKGEMDMKSVVMMTEVIKEGGSLLIFPEGNRTYAEFQFYISKNLPMILKQFKSTIVLFNIHGGTGTRPRWKDKHVRKGKMYGNIKDVIKYEEYKDMPNDILFERIKDGLKVFDSESNEKFESPYKAQYLEKMLFVCPKCKKPSTLVSELDHISCTSCGLKVSITDDLHLTSEDNDFNFVNLNDWYQFQRRWMREYEIEPNKIIFEDEDVMAFNADPGVKRRIIFEGKIILTDKELIMGTKRFDLTKISLASPISGNRFSFVYEDHQYLVRGKERFNPLKYVLAFNRLDTLISKKHLDDYYNLED